MNRIKRLLASLLLCGAASMASATGADIVVLMDASGTILPYFDEINNRVLVDISNKFLRIDDTFHLISFNSRVNLEVVQPVESEADISKIVSRFMLLYPLGQNSDFISGMNYTWQYISSLDANREKIVIIISDGIFNPPANSPYASLSAEAVKAEIAQLSRKIRGAGWVVYYIKVPFPDNAEIYSLDGTVVHAAATPAQNAAGEVVGSTGQASKGAGPAPAPATGSTKTAGGAKTAPEGKNEYYDISSEVIDDLGISKSDLASGQSVPLTFVDSVFAMPEITFPGDLGTKGRIFILPLKVRNVSDDTVNLELSRVLSNGVNVLEKSSFLNLGPKSEGTLRAEIHLPSTLGRGQQQIPLTLEFADGKRVVPQSGTISLKLSAFSPDIFLRAGVPLFLTLALVILAIIFVVILFFVIMRRTERPASDAISAADRKASAAAQPAATASNAATAQVITGRDAAPVIAGTNLTSKADAFNKLSDAARQASGPNPMVASESAASVLQKNAVPGSASAGLSNVTPGNQVGESQSTLASARNQAGQSQRAAVASTSLGDTQSAQVLSSFRGDSDKTILATKRGETVRRDADTLSAYAPEAKRLPFSVGKQTVDARDSIETLATSQKSDRSERMATLTAAAKKPERLPTLFKPADPDASVAVVKDNRALIQLDVHRQNPNIGKRNIHLMRAGAKLPIGGGASAFLIFLVKFPPRIAELRYDGDTCALAILRPEYFPYETANLIEDCIGRQFTVLSDKGYEVCFEFRTFEDPVEKLNRMLTAIRY